MNEYCRVGQGPALTNPAFAATESKGRVPDCDVLSFRSWWSIVDDALVTRAGAEGMRLNDRLQQLGIPALYTGESDETGLNRVDPKALEALFSLFYVKPSGRVGGAPAQALYDHVLAPTVRPLADTLGRLRQVPGLLDTMVARARSGHSTDLLSAYGALAHRLYGDDLESDASARVGFIVRRALDGSLPTLTKLLEQVLRDYDPKTLKKLEAPSAGLVTAKLTVEPADHDYVLTVDGKPDYFASVLGFVLVNAGKHTFLFEGEEGPAVTLERVIPKKTSELKVVLPRDRWKVYVETSGSSADIIIDGEKVAHGSLYHAFTFGKHVIETSDRCVVPERIELEVTAATRPDDISLEARQRMVELRVDLVDGKGAKVAGTWWGFGKRVPGGESDMVPLCWKSTSIYWPDGAKTTEKLTLEEDRPAVVTVRR